MPFFTILRGFKVPIPVLDAFLVANGLDETFGLAPFETRDPVSDFLRAKTGHPKTRLIIPYRRSYSHSDFGYIACAWIMTFAQRGIDMD